MMQYKQHISVANVLSKDISADKMIIDTISLIIIDDYL